MRNVRDFKAKSRRLARFWNRRLGNQLLVVTKVASEEVKALAGRLAGEANDGEISLETLRTFAAAYAAHRAKIDDDSVPVVAPCDPFWVVCSQIAGGNARLAVCEEEGELALSVEPFLESVEDLLRWECSDSEPWASAWRGQLLALAQNANTRYAVGAVPIIEPLHFVICTRGRERTEADLAENGELVRCLMSFGGTLNRFIADIERKALGSYQKLAYCAPFGPVRASTKLVDLTPYAGLDRSVFEKFGETEMKKIGGYLGGLIARVPLGASHLFEALVRMERIVAVRVARGEDAGELPGDIEEVRKITGDIPLIVETSYSECRKAIEEQTASRGVLYLVGGVPDALEANALAALARTYKPKT